MDFKALLKKRDIHIKLFEIGKSKGDKKKYLIDLHLLLNKENLLNLSLVVIIFLGVFFRFYNLGWDGGQNYQPDENNIAIAVSKLSIPDHLDPEFYAYNGVVLWILELGSNVMASITNNHDWLVDWNKLNIIGRYFSAFFSSVSIIVFYSVLRKLFSRSWAVFGTFLFSFCVGLIQTAHFAVSESVLLLELLTIILITLNIGEDYRNRKNWMFLFVATGIAIGTKTTGIIFMVIPFFTSFVLFLKTKDKRIIFYLIFYILYTALTVYLVSPLSFVFWEKFVESMKYEKAVVDGTIDVKYTVQFRNTPIYLFFIKNLFWYTGILPIAAFIGIFNWIYVGVKKRKFYFLAPLVFGLIYFGYVGGWYAKFIRYTIPFLPVFFIAAVYGVSFLYSKIKPKALKYLLVIIISAVSFLWTISFMSIYFKENSRITASKWMLANIPDHSSVITEHWDMRLPASIDGEYPRYNFITMLVFDPDTTAKVNEMANNLSEADYYIVGSQRGYGPITRIPDEYPYTSKFYKKLFSGELGYTKIKEIGSSPMIGNFKVDDSSAEETFRVFDHPTIYVFKNEKHLQPQQLVDKIIH